MFVHGVTREGTDEVGLGAVSEGERLGEGVERLCTHRTLCVVFLLLVALTGGEWLRDQLLHIPD